MNNLRCRKQGFKKYICKKTKKEVKYVDCQNCKHKEYKDYNPIKKRSYKQSKAEKERFSIFTDDLSKCIICGKNKDHLHEVFFGSNRLNSIKYGIVIPLCFNCHTMVHKNKNLQDIWHTKGQIAFEKYYPDLDFLKIFGKNYK